MNTALIMISACVGLQLVNPELDLEEGSIGIKIVGQSNERIDSDSPCISMQIQNLIWLRKFLVFEKFTSTSNVCMDALNSEICSCVLYINHGMTHCCKKESWAKMDKKCKI